MPVAGSVATPTQLGGSRIVKMLGMGGIGAVDADEEIAPGRPVVLKTTRPELDARHDARSRSPRGRTVARGWHDALKLYGIKDGKASTRLKLGRTHHGQDLSYSPDGRTLAAAMDVGVQLIDPRCGKVFRTIPFAGGFLHVAYPPGGQHLIAGVVNGVLCLVCLGTPRKLAPPPRPKPSP